MPGDSLNQFFESSLNLNKYLGIQVEKQYKPTRGVARTDGISPQLLKPFPNDPSGNVQTSGFTPLWYYPGEIPGTDLSTSYWRTSSPYVVDLTQDPNYKNMQPVQTSDRFQVTRKVFEDYDDTRQEDFKYSNALLEPIQNANNNRHTFNGTETNPFRLNNYENTSYENNDPIAYGFEIVINVESSPLLNGSMETFIKQFGNLTEVSSRSQTLKEFKQQFYKFFKTNTPISTVGNSALNFAQISSAAYDNLTGGLRQDYLAYYLKKISGLEHLIESNTPEKNKSFVDYRKDKITLTFTEDVSLSLGTLASLYKLLYWSRINGKNVIPENLLRFDCFIIVSELRNYTRLRKSLSSNNPAQTLDVLKDNLSRYVYNLYECQLFFDKMSHPGEINLGDEPKVLGDSYDIIMDFKYSTMKFEKWVPDANLFGKYVAINNDRTNPTLLVSKETNSATITVGTNSYSSISFEENNLNPIIINTVSSSVKTAPSYNQNIGGTATPPNALAVLKQKTLKNLHNLATSFEHNVREEAQGVINKEFSLLNKALDKVRNSSGMGKMSQPTNVYYGIYDDASKASGLSTRFFYDIHNELRTFGGDQLGAMLGG